MYNNRFKEEDPFAYAPKTTKWRLKKKKQSENQSRLNENNLDEDGRLRNTEELDSADGFVHASTSNLGAQQIEL